MIYGRLLDARQWARIRLATDFLALYLASALAVFADSKVGAMSSDRWLAAIFPVVVVVIMRAYRSPDERFNASLLDTLTYVLGVVSLATMLIASVDSLLGGSDALQIATRTWLFAVVYLGATRVMLVSVRRRALRTDGMAIPTLIVGAGVVGMHLVKRLVGDPGYGLRPVGLLDSDPLPTTSRAGLSLPVLGGLDDLGSAIARTGARHVIIAFSGAPDHILVSKVRESQALGVEVSLVPRLYEAINERTTLDHVGGLPLLTLHQVDPRGWQFTIKHALDRVVAGFSLLIASPLLAAIATAVRLSSPGPILFRQRRVGRDGHEFTMLKFRTMQGHPSSTGEADAAWAAQIMTGDPEDSPPAAEPAARTDAAPDRVTRVGRLLRTYSLDELPQLINVLRGDMSLVGPRPERVAYVRDFEQFVDRYAERHRVKSGLTGWAQINGLRGRTSIEDRVEWDNYYILNWSLRLDLRIILLTLAAVLRFRDR